MRTTQFHRGRLLLEHETYDATPSCPACGDVTPRTRIAVLQRSPVIALLQCGACGAASASRMPTPEVLSSYYATYYSGTEGEQVTLHGLDGYARHIARSLGPIAPHPGNALLDFGGGDGSLGVAVANLLDPGMVVTLVDHDEPRAPMAGKLVWSKDLAGVEGRHRVVLASAVLEHIPDVRRTLARVLELVEPGGVLYARTPWMAPFMGVIPGLDFTYPGHVHDLGPAFWNRLTARCAGEFELLVSRPSRVETWFSRSPARTVAAHLLKLPARIEVKLRGRPLRLLWPFAGGWEVVLRRAHA
jgi:transcription elongation factor Elf1